MLYIKWECKQACVTDVCFLEIPRQFITFICITLKLEFDVQWVNIKLYSSCLLKKEQISIHVWLILTPHVQRLWSPPPDLNLHDYYLWRTRIVCENPTFTAQAKRQYSKKNHQYFQYRALLCAQKHFHKMHGLLESCGWNKAS